MKRKFKLIKEFPGSGKLGTIVETIPGLTTTTYDYGKFPEFWKEIKEECKEGDWVWSNTPNVQRDTLGGDKGFIGKIVEIDHNSWDSFRVSVSTKLYPEYKRSPIENNERYVWCDDCRKATKEEVLEFLIKESGFEIGDEVESNERKHIIKSFHLYNENNNDFSVACDEYWEKTKCWFLVIRSEIFSVPANGCKKVEKKKEEKLELGDGKITIIVNSKGEILADGNIFDIADIKKIYDVMLGRKFNWSNDLPYTISFPRVNIGCATFDYFEIAQIINAYEKLNGK